MTRNAMTFSQQMEFKEKLYRDYQIAEIHREQIAIDLAMHMLDVTVAAYVIDEFLQQFRFANDRFVKAQLDYFSFQLSLED